MDKSLLTFGLVPLALALCAISPQEAQASDVATLPFATGFDTKEDFDAFTVIDNGDGFKWEYDSTNQNANSQGAFGTPDDWLVSPAFQLEAGKEYVVNFDVCSDYYGSTYGQELEVWLGTGVAKEDFTNQLGEKMYIEGTEVQSKELKFKVSDTGIYHVAFRVVKTGVFHGTILDNVQVREGVALFAPDMVSDLEAVPGMDGALEALISFKAPENTVSGDALASITKIDVLREGAIVKTFENPNPGEALYFTDSEGLKDGFATWRVIGYLDDSPGEMAEVTAYVGLDVPGAPVKVTAVDMLDGRARLEWMPADRGAHSGYVDNSKLLYKVYNLSSQGMNLIGTVDGTTIDIALNLAEGQVAVWFSVSAVNEMGEGETTWANEYIAGEPYSLPYEESFPKCQTESGLWVLHDGTSGGTWKAYPYEVYDGDGGAMVFTPEKDLETAVLESGMITLAGADAPRLVFRYLVYPGAQAALRMKVRSEGQLETDLLRNLDYSTMTGEERWETEQIDLTAYKDKKYITLWFEAEVADPSKAVVVDDLFVRDVKDKDMRILMTNVPEEVTAGRTVSVTANVENRGFTTAGEYSVVLYVNGEKAVEIPGTELDPYSGTILDLPFTADMSTELMSLSAEVILDGDAEPDDNITVTSYVIVEAADVPVITDLTASEANHVVTLNWTAPENQLKPITDGAEDYVPFTINAMGPWTLFDADALNTDAFAVGKFPNSGTPFAFIVFNPEEVGIDVTNYNTAMYAPYSGKQYFAAVCGDGNNDNWLISEQLSGTPQTISLFARALSTQYGNEKFEIRYSTTDAQPSSFTEVAATENALAEWKEYSVEIPAEARYFAIRHISEYVWMFMVDDITYTPANDLKGFNIYRDDKKIAYVDETTYTDTLFESGDHGYNVTGVYTQGESKFSNTANVDISGIDDLISEDKYVNVFTLQGTEIFRGLYGDMVHCDLAEGVYVIVIDGKARKMVIK